MRFAYINFQSKSIIKNFYEKLVICRAEDGIDFIGLS